MSRIEKLIQELCPNGVPFYPLSTVATVKTGDVITKKKIQESPGPFPVINSGKQPLGYVADFNAEDEPIGVASRGSVGWVSWSPGKIFRGSLNYGVVPDKNKVDERFLYFVMKSKDAEIQQLSTHEGIPALNKSNLVKFQVPVPPLEVQREIVRVLDQFTQLEAELEAELEARRRQYEHYLNRSFEIVRQEDWTPLAQIGAIERGNALQKKDLLSEGVPAFHYGQVYTHYGLHAVQTKSYVSEAFASGKRVLHPGDVFIATTSENEVDLGKAVAWLGEAPAVASSDAYIFRPDADARYVSYFFASRHFETQKKRFITGTKVKRISGDALGQIRMPLPPPEQQRVVADRLDQFDALVNDLSVGLPAELAARRKQYEYYRDKLLTFKELAA